jgi:23S rRNA (uracil1939-C5)-methyltransferase
MSNKIVRQVRDQLMDTGLIPYDPATRSGTLRSLVVREASDTGDTLVSLGVARKIHPEGVAEAVSRASDNVKGFVMSVNRKRSKNAVPKSEEVVTGGGTIVEKVLGLEIAWSASSFAQVNTDQAQRLYSLALDEACLTGSEKVLDLYCGAGTLSRVQARNAARVTGVELLEKAVEDAQENALRNGITNCSFVCDDVLASVGDQVVDVDVLTINPPRAGMDRAVVDKICRMKVSRIVYISCNALTLVRDLVIFKRRGFKIGRAQPVDLFPHTHHCEVIVGLSRNER